MIFKLNFLNIFSRKKQELSVPDTIEKEDRKEGRGYSEPDFFSDVWSMVGLFEETFTKESEEIVKFREMNQFDIIGDVIFDAKTEAFTLLDNKKFIKLLIKNSKLDKYKVKLLEEKFDEFYNMLDLNRTLFDYIEEYLVTSKLYLEKLRDSSNKLIGLKLLPAESMGRIINPKTGEIIKFFQIVKNEKQPIEFEPEDIVYLSFGQTPYLRNIVSLYNKLRILDPSIVIYRFARAPERLLFKIYVGRMPRDKAWSYVNKIKQNLNQKFEINENGELEGKKAFKSFLSNFYLPITADDKSSDIQSIAGSNNLDDLKDMLIFIKRLYKALHYPLSRVESLISDSASYSIFTQRPDSITLDEKKWTVFLQNNIQIPFLELFSNLFLETLNLDKKDINKKQDIAKNKTQPSNSQQTSEALFEKINELKNNKDSLVTLTLEKDDIELYAEGANDIEKIKEQELFEIKLNNYGTMREYKEFNKVYLLKQIFGLSDNEIDEIIKLAKDERNKILEPPSQEEEY